MARISRIDTQDDSLVTADVSRGTSRYRRAGIQGGFFVPIMVFVGIAIAVGVGLAYQRDADYRKTIEVKDAQISELQAWKDAEIEKAERRLHRIERAMMQVKIAAESDDFMKTALAADVYLALTSVDGKPNEEHMQIMADAIRGMVGRHTEQIATGE